MSVCKGGDLSPSGAAHQITKAVLGLGMPLLRAIPLPAPPGPLVEHQETIAGTSEAEQAGVPPEAGGLNVAPTNVDAYNVCLWRHDAALQPETTATYY